MKKWSLLILGSFFMINAQASGSYCGYKDFFHLSYQTHPGIYIVQGYSDYDVMLQFIGPRSFVLRDGPECRSGYAHVTVAYDDFNWCVLDIKDGPYMNHPRVNASCSGLRYLGMDYDGTSSFSYTIHLD